MGWLDGITGSTDMSEQTPEIVKDREARVLQFTGSQGVGHDLATEQLTMTKRPGWASLVVQTVKSPPAMRETWVQSLGQEDPRRRAWQPTPVFLPGESPWTEEPGGLQSMGA